MTKGTAKTPRHPRPASKGDAKKVAGDAVASLLDPDVGTDAVRSEGQRLLTAVRESTAQVGARVGTSKNTVSCWRTGTKRPGEAARAKLLEVYGIPPAAWDASAGATPAVQPELPDASSLPGKATIDLVNELVTRWMKVSSDPQIPLSMQAKVSDGPLAKYLQIKSRLEREAEFLEDKIVLEHPAFRRIVKSLVAALKPHPDALRAVRDAIGSLEG